MKWIAFLLSFYLLTLSGFTCNAESACCTDELEQHSDGGCDDNHESQHACVPFLACGACNSILVPKVAFHAPIVFSVITKVTFQYQELTWVNAPCSIWQPPKIA